MKNLMVLTLVSLCAISCGKKKDSDSNVVVPNSNGDVIGASLTKDQVQRMWASNCVSSSEGNGPVWASHSTRAVRTLKMNDGKFNLMVIAFDSDTCDGEKAQALVSVSGTFSLGAETTAKFNNISNGSIETVKGNEIDFAVSEFSATPLSENAVGWMNIGSGFCSHTDWAFQTSIALTEGKDCSAFADSSLRAFTKATIRDGNLFLGAYYEDLKTGSAADVRPSKWAVGEEFLPAEEK